MKRPTHGFTLIEQIAAITLAGATSAVVLPPLIDLQAGAEASTLASLAGAAGSAMVMNYGGCLVTGQVVQAGKCVSIHNCNQVGELLLAELPAAYRVDDRPLGAAGGQLPGQAARCTLVQVNQGTAVGFHGMAAGR